MKKEKKIPKAFIEDNSIFDKISDPELEKVITDVIHYSEDYNIGINEDYF